MTIRCSHIVFKALYTYQKLISYELKFFNLKLLTVIGNIQAKSMVFLNIIIFASHLQKLFSKRHVDYQHNSTPLFWLVCYLRASITHKLAQHWTHFPSRELTPSYTQYIWSPVSSCYPLVPLGSSYLHSHRTSTIHIFGFIILSEQFAWIKYTQTHWAKKKRQHNLWKAIF